jgi:hypothetical protein
MQQKERIIVTFLLPISFSFVQTIRPPLHCYYPLEAVSNPHDNVDRLINLLIRTWSCTFYFRRAASCPILELHVMLGIPGL